MLHGQAFETWVDQRDAGVIRQQRDFSCGLAALATLMTHEFGDPTTEDSLLRGLFRGDGTRSPASRSGVSFADLAILGRERGYHVAGYRVALEDLSGFAVPVIVSLEVAGRSHFSLLKSVAEDGSVWLADPSWGNRRLAAWEFAKLFMRHSSPRGDELKGRVLLVVPGAALSGTAARRTINRRAAVEAPIHLDPMLP